MDIQIDKGVNMAGIDPRMWSKAEAIADIFRAEGVKPVITSAARPIEGKFSFHWMGLALDWRGRHLVGETARNRVFERLKKLLGTDFDVKMYDLDQGGHYHIEYDPR